MVLLTIIYVALIGIFCIFVGLIVRHMRRYAYLAPGFKPVALIFGTVALVIFFISLYFLFQLYEGPSAASSLRQTPSSGESGGISF